MAKTSKLQKVFSKFVDSLSQREKDYLISKYMESKEAEPFKSSSITRVTSHDWRKTRPDGIFCATDRYYSSLANKLIDSLNGLRIEDGMPEGAIREAAMSCAAYLEDIVTGTGVWQSFRSLYRRTYGKWLPFFDTDHDDYLLDEPNIEDVRFLIWQSLSRTGLREQRIFNPLSPLTDEVSKAFYTILEEEYETAPESVRLKRVVDVLMDEGSFFSTRELALWLRYNNKIIASPFALEAFEANVAEASKTKNELISSSQLSYHIRYMHVWDNAGPMGCSVSRYLAEMARAKGDEELAEKLDTVEVIPEADFHITGHDSKVVTLEDSTGDTFRVATDSISDTSRINGMKGYHATIVRFGDLWHLNGMSVFLTDNPFEDKSEHTVYHYSSAMKNFVEAVVRKRRGRRIFYCATEKEMHDIAGMKGYVLNPDFNARNYVLMLSKERGPIVLANKAECFKDRTNPFYNRGYARENVLGVIATDHLPDDIAMLIADRKLFPDAAVNSSLGVQAGRSIVQDNLRFIIGFFRPVDI